MMLAALIFAATTYQSLLSFDPPVFESGKSKYEFYAEGDVGEGRKIVVYGFIPVRRGTSEDYEHAIMVTMIRKNEVLSARRDLTYAVFNNGNRGQFRNFRAKVSAFTLGKAHFVDVQLWSAIAGDLSAASDVILRITHDNTLVIASTLENTEELSRKSAREVRRTNSQLQYGDGALLWTKKECLEFNGKVNCQTTRTTYRPLRHGLSPGAPPPKGKLTTLR